MPVTIKSAAMKYKDASGTYVGIDAISETTTSEQIAAIEAKGAETRASIPDDYTALSDEVDGLKSALNVTKHGISKYEDTLQVDLTRGTLVNGAYNPATGVLQENYTYRVSTITAVEFPYPIKLTIANGFKIIPYLYQSGAWTGQGWQTGSYSIEESTPFYFQIARVTEDTSETADINTFVDQITVSGSPIIDYIDKNNSAVSCVISEISQYEDFGTGLLARGHFDRAVYNPVNDSYNLQFQYRISARNAIIFPSDVTMKIADGFRLLPYRYENGEWIQKTWVTGSYNVGANDPFYCQIARVVEDTSEIADINSFLKMVVVTEHNVNSPVAFATNKALGYIYPEMFEDDTQDDTTAIQSAIDAAGTNGTVVLRSDKTYVISSTLYIRNPDVKIISLTGASHAPVIHASDDFDEEYNVMISVTASGVHFKNITVEGNYQCNGIRINRKTHDDDEIELINIDAYIQNCYIRKCNTGLTVFGRGCKILFTHFTDCHIGVAFASLQLYDPDQGEYVYPDIRGWIVEECRFHGIGLEQYKEPGSSLPPFTGISDIANFDSWCIKNLNYNARQFYISIRNNIADGRCFGGFFYGCPDGLVLQNNILSLDNSNRILAYLNNTISTIFGQIMGNVCYSGRNSRVGAALTIGTSSPIYVNNGASVTIKDNVFLDYGSSGVYIQNGRNIKIINNLFDGVNYDDNIGSVHVVITATCSIVGNTFIRHVDSTENNIINDVTKADINISKFNTTKNVIDNLTDE